VYRTGRLAGLLEDGFQPSASPTATRLAPTLTRRLVGAQCAVGGALQLQLHHGGHVGVHRSALSLAFKLFTSVELLIIRYE
jgi:hypothetical protein